MTEADFVRVTRESYDTMADYYAQWIRDEVAARPVDLALLTGRCSSPRRGLAQCAGAHASRLRRPQRRQPPALELTGAV